jgi:hypothetical protein
MRPLFSGEGLLHLLERCVLSVFDLANPFPDFFPLGGANFDFAQLCLDHIPDEFPDFSGFAVALLIADRGECHIFFIRKTKRDAIFSHGDLIRVKRVH